MKTQVNLLIIIVLVFCLAPSLFAEADFSIVIKNHQFEPSKLEIPANKKVKIMIDNQDPTSEEFESHELNREKIIKGNSKAFIFVGPVKPGVYPFFGEFNPKTAQGEIIAKE